MDIQTRTREILDFQNLESREFRDIYLSEKTTVSKTDERAMKHMFFHEYTSYPHVPVGPVFSKMHSRHFEELIKKLFNNPQQTKQKQLFLGHSVNMLKEYHQGNTLTFGTPLFGTPNPTNMLFGLRYNKTLFVLENPEEAQTVSLSGFDNYYSRELYLVKAGTEFEISKVEESDIKCSKVLYCQKFYEKVQIVHLRAKGQFEE